MKPTISALVPALVLPFAVLLARPARAEAQAGESSVALVPLVGGAWQGHRYELAGGVTGPAGQNVTVKLGPTTGLELGLGAEVRAWPRFSLFFSGSYAALDYLREESGGSGPQQRNIDGDQSLYRFSGGVQYRVVPRAPGFFSAGLVASYFDPTEPSGYSEVPEPRLEWGGYGGIGLRIGGQSRHLRAEGRLMVMSVGGEDLQGATILGAGGTYEPRSVALDYSVNLGFVFEL